MDGHLSLNPGGVCDNCGEPAFAHVAGRCPTDTECEAIAAQLDAWRALVEPAKAAYQDARKKVKSARNWVRKGKADPTVIETVETAEQEADRLWGLYQAAIRQADREAVG